MNKHASKTKKTILEKRLKGYGALMVAFSGGVDSTFLLAVAHDVLGENVVAVTSDSPVHSVREMHMATAFTREKGIEHIVFTSREMEDEGFVNNPSNRCYICKKMLFDEVIKIASENGINHIAHGANLDDLGDYRPGFKAADEMGIIAPLVETNLSKPEIRELSKEMGLQTWDKPAMACLATRIPYGSRITIEKLEAVEKAEFFLMDLGFPACRVRHHDTIARIELPSDDISRFMKEAIRMEVVKKIKHLGFSFVSIDLEGYFQGSMNRNL